MGFVDVKSWEQPNNKYFKDGQEFYSTWAEKQLMMMKSKFIKVNDNFDTIQQKIIE